MKPDLPFAVLTNFTLKFWFSIRHFKIQGRLAAKERSAKEQTLQFHAFSAIFHG
jgi:hypothetical protein